MRRHVGVRMSPQSVRMRYLDAAENQPSALFQRMEIKPLSDPEPHHPTFKIAADFAMTLTRDRSQSKLSSLCGNSGNVQSSGSLRS